MLNVSKVFSGLFIGLFLLVLCSGNSFAGIAGNHYTNGVEGIKPCVVPPPGFYWRMYNVFYDSDKLADPDGKDIGIDFELSVFAQANRFIYVTEHKILGADYFWNVVVPFIYTDIEIGSGVHGVKDNAFEVGDITIEPFALGWHGARYDAAAGAMLVVPSGRSKGDRIAHPGKDYWTGIFSLGITTYLDAAKTWSIGALGRYEIHSKKNGVDVTPGNDFHVEWGVGKALPSDWKIGWLRFWEVGVTGYAQWQITDDRGDDITWDKVHDRVFSIGPEVRFVIAPLKMLVEMKTQWELGAVDRTEGIISVLTFTYKL